MCLVGGTRCGMHVDGDGVLCEYGHKYDIAKPRARRPLAETGCEVHVSCSSGVSMPIGCWGETQFEFARSQSTRVCSRLRIPKGAA
eukprot:4965286-Prymnesium_polylepis.1